MRKINLRGGSIVVDQFWNGSSFEQNKCVSVDEKGEIQNISSGKCQPNAVEFPRVCLLPGMINAHSHAFHRELRYHKSSEGSSAPGEEKLCHNFWSWRDGMYSLAQQLANDPQRFYQVCFETFSEMLRCGITTVGEFHYLHHSSSHPFELDFLVLKAAEDVGIRIVLLQAFYETAGVDGKPIEGVQKYFFTESLDAYWKQFEELTKKTGELQSLGVVAHSVRSVKLDNICQLHQEAQRRGLVFHMHLEEQIGELNDTARVHGQTPLQLLLDSIQIDDKFCAVHLTQTKEDDMQQFVDAGGNVCICPLTEGRLGDGIPNWPSSDPGKHQISYGTDCNYKIDILEEMRWSLYCQQMKRQLRGFPDKHPALAAQEMFDIATHGGARSLGLEGKCGSIQKGYQADFILVNLNHPILKGSSSESLLENLILAGSADSLIVGSCVSGVLSYFGYSKLNIDHSIFLPLPMDENAMEVQEYFDKIPVQSGDFAVELTEALMRIQSTSGQEKEVAEIFGKWLESKGWQVRYQPLAQNPKRINILATQGLYDPQNNNPSVILCSHLDTVPPYIPVSWSLDGTQLRGRGSSDAKGQVAAMTNAAFRIARSHPELGKDMGLLFVVGEEVDHVGAIEANKLGLAPKLIICGEPTESKQASGQKGVLKVELTAKGVAGHSGYPERGVSAVHALIHVLSKVQEEEWPTDTLLGPTTVNIGTISGGNAANIIAPHAEAILAFRLVTPPEPIIETLNKLITNTIVEQRVLTQNSPLVCDFIDNEHIKAEPVAFNTDLPYIHCPDKTQKILFGPGSIKVAHGPNEFISTDELRKGVDWLVQIILQMAQRR